MNSNMLVYDVETSPIFEDIQKYQSLISSLFYIARSTRPDILFATTLLTRFNKSPKKIHYNLAINILRFLVNTKEKKIKYQYSGDFNLVGHVDSDFANRKDSRKSTTGYILYLNDNPFLWVSYLQKLLAQSSDEAEIIAANDASRDLIFYRDLINQTFNIFLKPKLFIDNINALKFCESGAKTRTKHLDIKLFYIKEKFENNEIEFFHISSNENTADIFTKNLPKNKFNYLSDGQYTVYYLFIR